jgi:hypothetical protein
MLKMKKLDLTKSVQTRDGRQVRIYATDAGGKFPIHGAYRNEADTCWIPYRWTLDGMSFLSELVQAPADLVNIPQVYEVKEAWVNIYDIQGEKAMIVGLYSDRQSADIGSRGQRIACVRIPIKTIMNGTFEE